MSELHFPDGFLVFLLLHSNAFQGLRLKVNKKNSEIYVYSACARSAPMHLVGKKSWICMAESMSKQTDCAAKAVSTQFDYTNFDTISRF